MAKKYLLHFKIEEHTNNAKTKYLSTVLVLVKQKAYKKQWTILDWTTENIHKSYKEVYNYIIKLLTNKSFQLIERGTTNFFTLFILKYIDKAGQNYTYKINKKSKSELSGLFDVNNQR